MIAPRKFGRDRRGVAAVEFALIAPVLILIYFGLADLCQSLIAERKAGHVASAVGDLVAQNSAVTKSTLDGVFDISKTVIRPFPISATSLQICVFSVTKDATGKATVDWSHAEVSGAPASFCPAKAAVMTEGTASTNLPTGLIGNSESIIGSKALYSYTSGFEFTYTGSLKHVASSTITFNPVFWLRPRKSDQVTCSDC